MTRLFAISAAIAVFTALSITPAQAQSQNRVTTTHEDWVVRCSAEQANLPCDMYQGVINRSENTQVLQISLGYSRQHGKYGLQALVPLGFLIPPGVLLKIDDGAEFRNLRFSRCEANGCLLEGEATNEMIQAMAAGLNGRIIMMNPDRQTRAIPFSLKGFSAAFREVNASIGN